MPLQQPCFVLGTCMTLQLHTLIVTPMCLVASSCQHLLTDMLRCCLQVRDLERGVDVVVGTPGRVIDLIERGSLKLGEVR